MMHEAVNGSDGHHGIRKDTVPLAGSLIGGDEQALTLVAMSNELKENRGFRLST